jgi:hypothetical protein
MLGYGVNDEEEEIASVFAQSPQTKIKNHK